ncbi:MAG: spore coat protein U domain-containing protein [Sphingomonas sp.]
MNISKILSVRNVSVPALAVAAVFAQPALAQTAGANMATSAEVTENCTVSSSPIVFGDVDVTTGAAVPGAGGISVVCTNGTEWSASADAGAGADATQELRQMSDGAATLDYVLYTEPTRTVIWGDGTDGTETIDDTGTGTAQATVIYGRIVALQNTVVAGSYSDTVAVTVTY